MKRVKHMLENGEDMEKVAKSYKLDVVNPMMFGSADSVEGLGQAVYVLDAFTKPVGTILGPTQINGREVVSKVLEQVRADPAMLAAQKSQIMETLKKQKANVQLDLMRDSIITELVKEGKLKRDAGAIKSLQASYSPK